MNLITLKPQDPIQFLIDAVEFSVDYAKQVGERHPARPCTPMSCAALHELWHPAQYAGCSVWHMSGEAFMLYACLQAPSTLIHTVHAKKICAEACSGTRPV